MKQIQRVLIVFVALANFQDTIAASVLTDFGSGLDGWTAQNGSWSWVASGGNPGGHGQFLPTGGSGLISAPTKFLGDLTSFAGGSLSFDLISFVDDGTSVAASFGEVQITDGIDIKTSDVVPAQFIGSWTSFNIPMTAATWGFPSQAGWQAFLSSVTGITVNMNSQGFSDVIGVDNIALSPVPVPPAIWLFGSALGLLGWVRKRAR